MSYSHYLKIIRHWATKLMKVRLVSVWYSFNAPYKSNTYLCTDKKHPCGSITARTRKLDNTIRYLGVEIEDALNISENTDS